MTTTDMLSLWHDFKKELILLTLSGLSLLASILASDAFPADPAWVAIVLCGVPIIKEAVTGLVTSFDIKADVLVATALVASVITGEDFAAGEVAFIMQLGALLEEATTARARAGIEKLPERLQIKSSFSESFLASGYFFRNSPKGRSVTVHALRKQ